MIISRTFYGLMPLILMSSLFIKSMEEPVYDKRPHDLICKKDFLGFSQLLKDNPKLAHSLNDGDYNDTPIITAVSGEDARFVQELIKYKVNVNFKGYEGRTALHRACALGKIKNIKLLLKANADINTQSNSGSVPGMLAFYRSWDSHDYIACIKLLIKRNMLNDTQCFDGLESIKGAIECSQRSDKCKDYGREIYKEVENLAANAEQLRADYLEKKAVTKELKLKQKRT